MQSPHIFSVVLPCYNEAETLPQLFARFEEVLRNRDDLEVLFVNNGSTDNSTAVFASEATKPNRAWARVIEVKTNRGYGYGILSGLRAANGQFVGWTHADTQYDPKYVTDGFQRLISSVTPERTLLQGRRDGRAWFDRLFTAVMTLVACTLLKVRVSDINAQPKLFPRALLKEMKSPPDDFSLDLYLLVVARKLGFTIDRMPVVFARRNFGEAKGGAGSLKLKWKLTKRTWSFMHQLRRDIRAGRL